jgi:PAS domain-containing protein
MAAEPSLAIDREQTILALSRACQELLGLRESAVGRKLLPRVLRLLDFGPDARELTEGEVGKIPPLLALSSGRLARGLLRVRSANGSCTLDAIATPLMDDNKPLVVVGSLTFFTQV